MHRKIDFKTQAMHKYHTCPEQNQRVRAPRNSQFLGELHAGRRLHNVICTANCKHANKSHLLSNTTFIKHLECPNLAWNLGFQRSTWSFRAQRREGTLRGAARVEEIRGQLGKRVMNFGFPFSKDLREWGRCKRNHCGHFLEHANDWSLAMGEWSENLVLDVDETLIERSKMAGSSPVTERSKMASLSQVHPFEPHAPPPPFFFSPNFVSIVFFSLNYFISRENFSS